MNTQQLGDNNTNYPEGYAVDSRDSRRGFAADCCEHGAELSDYTEGEECIRQLRYGRFHWQDSAPCRLSGGQAK